MELNHYIEQAIESAESGAEIGIIHAIGSLTHKNFSDSKFVFDLTKLVAGHPESVREMIQPVIERSTSADFQKRVSFIMPMVP